MSKSSCKVLIIREGSSDQRIFRISRYKLALYTTLTVLFLFATIFVSVKFVSGKLTKYSMASVENENRELRLELDRMGQRLKSLNNDLEIIYEEDDKLRLLANMPKIDDDTRQVGIGGTVAPDFDYDSENESVRKLIYDLEKLERELELQISSFKEIERQFVKNADLISHTPSIRPLEGGFVSSGFGWRRDPFTGRRAHHNGVDYSNEPGAPVMTTADGKVVLAKRMPGMGKTVIIDHGYGFRTAYGHLSKILVKNGQTVERSQKIGEVGNTGRSTGPHLHYEVQVDGKAVDPIDYLFDNFAVRYPK